MLVKETLCFFGPPSGCLKFWNDGFRLDWLRNETQRTSKKHPVRGQDEKITSPTPLAGAGRLVVVVGTLDAG